METVAILIFVLILILDVINHFAGKTLAYVINGIDFVLHLALIFSLLVLDFELKYLVLAFLSSLLVYTLGFLVKERLGKEEQNDV